MSEDLDKVVVRSRAVLRVVEEFLQEGCLFRADDGVACAEDIGSTRAWCVICRLNLKIVEALRSV